MDGHLGVEHPRTNHRPAGLVVVNVGRVDDRDIEISLSRKQAGCHRDAGRAGSDDNDIMADIRDTRWRFAAIGDAADNA